MKTHAKRLSRTHGFTLTELIMVIVIIGILSGVVGSLLSGKFGAVFQSTNRAKWVQEAEFALFHIRQDLANSVPNSVFIDGSDQTVEFLAAPPNAELYAARYRDRNLPPYDRLQLGNDSSFDVFVSAASTPTYVSIGTLDANSLRTDWENFHLGSNDTSIAEIGSSSTAIAENGSPITNVVLTANHKFPRHSSYFRAYFFDGPIGYECNTTANTLSRFSGYTNLSTANSFAVRTASASRSRILTSLVSCQFELIAGTSSSPPSLRVKLEIGDTAESIQLVDTILLSNAS